MKSIKNITVNNEKSYLGFWNELVNEQYNAYHYSIGKKHVDVDYSALTEKIEMKSKSPKFEVGDRVRTTKYKKQF